MKIDCPTNLCKICYENLVETKVEDPKTKKIIGVCWDCYSEKYDPDENDDYEMSETL